MSGRLKNSRHFLMLIMAFIGCAANRTWEPPAENAAELFWSCEAGCKESGLLPMGPLLTKKGWRCLCVAHADGRTRSSLLE